MSSRDPQSAGDEPDEAVDEVVEETAEAVDSFSLVSSPPVEKYKDGDARWETGEISAGLRAEVLERDRGTCRFCGGVPESPALHHLVYRSQGGLNVVSNLITVHWMYAPRCHERMHSNGARYRALGLTVATRPGLTVLALARWERAAAVKARRLTDGR